MRTNGGFLVLNSAVYINHMSSMVGFCYKRNCKRHTFNDNKNDIAKVKLTETG